MAKGLSRNLLLAEIFVVRTSGPVSAREADKAKRALSLAVQGTKYQDPDGDWWEFGGVCHVESMEMLGRRSVCADEGHVIPERPKGHTFGCSRCDFVFTGKAQS